MELILQTGLEHQEKPVNAIAQVFENTPIEQPLQYFENPVFDFSYPENYQTAIRKIRRN